MSDEAATPDAPRKPSGPIRRIYKAIYWIISLNLMLSTAVGVTMHVFRDPEGSGPRVAEGATPDSPEGQACRAELAGHYRSLQSQLHLVLSAHATPALAFDWQDFTQTWRIALDQTRHRCRLSDDAMAPLAEIARDLEKLRVSYTTAVNAFAATGQDPLLRLERALMPAPVAPRGEGFPPTRPE